MKLASAIISMLEGACQGANDLSLDVNLKANAYIRGNQFMVIKGRRIIAIMMESFRTRDRIDVIYTIDHFTKIQCPGDNKLATVKATWLEVIGRMRHEDVRSKNALRDLLYLNVKGSNVMKLELQLLYEIHSYDDPDRSNEKLLQIMDRAIARQRENKNLQDTNTGLRQLVTGEISLPRPLQNQSRNLILPSQTRKDEMAARARVKEMRMMRRQFTHKQRRKGEPKRKPKPGPKLKAVGDNDPLQTRGTLRTYDASSTTPKADVLLVINAHSVTRRKSRRKARARAKDGRDQDLRPPLAARGVRILARRRRIVSSG